MRSGRGGMVRGVAGLVLCALACAGLLTDGRPASSDEDIARFLLGQAKKAISTRKYEVAVQKLERARSEDPDLAEASYLLAQVHEKRKNPAEALRAYRAFRDTCARLGSKLDRKTKRLLKRATKRIGQLDKGGDELSSLQNEFAARVIAFANTHKEADQDIAVDALRRVAAVHPEHKAAAALLAELAGVDDLTDDDGDVDPESSPIAGINSWRDMLKHRDIPPSGEKSYKRKVLTLDQEDGSIFWTAGPTVAPKTFVYEIEFRFLEEHKPGYLVGLAFGQDEKAERAGKSEFVMAFAQKSLLHIVQSSNNKNVDVGECAIDAKPLKTWRTMTVAVEGRKVRVFLDGKKLLTSSIAGRKSLEGPIGVFHQRCVCEVRRLRLGVKK